MASVILKNKREKSILRHHPWVFSEAIATMQGKPEPGETVDILAANGTLLAKGAYSPESMIAVRVWTFDPKEQVTALLMRSRLEQAIRVRASIGIEKTSNACRLVNAESDGLPGLIVDRYGDYVICQFLSRGPEFWKKNIVSCLAELTSCAGIYERSDADVREKEGLSKVTGLLYGQEPPELMEITEGPCKFLVDVKRGHKTGFYLDQRDNRALVAEYAHGREVLNCFAYTGGFGVYSLKGDAARVTNIESSADALSMAQRNIELNGLNMRKVENVAGDVFQVLRTYRDSRRQFGLIILDPPKFVSSRNQLEQASRGYKDINLLAFKLLKPGGFLFTFSCSALMPPDLFQKIVADSALDAGREAQIVRRMTQAPDHVISLNFPEGTYLKGLVCRVG